MQHTVESNSDAAAAELAIRGAAHVAEDALFTDVGVCNTPIRQGRYWRVARGLVIRCFFVGQALPAGNDIVEEVG